MRWSSSSVAERARLRRALRHPLSYFAHQLGAPRLRPLLLARLQPARLVHQEALGRAVTGGHPRRPSSLAMPFDARPVIAGGPATLVSNAADATASPSSDSNHSRRPGPSAAGSTTRP